MVPKRYSQQWFSGFRPPGPIGAVRNLLSQLFLFPEEQAKNGVLRHSWWLE
jgi:hypothetical protein